MDPIIAAAFIGLVGVIVTAVLHTGATRGNAAAEVREETLRLRDERLHAFAERLGDSRIALAEERNSRKAAEKRAEAAEAELEKLRRPRALNTGGRS